MAKVKVARVAKGTVPVTTAISNTWKQANGPITRVGQECATDPTTDEITEVMHEHKNV